MKVSKEHIQREKGYLYYVDKAGYVAKVKRGKKGGKRVGKTSIKRMPGYLYYVDKEGYICNTLIRGRKRKRLKA